MIEPLKVSDRGEWFSIFGRRFANYEDAIVHRDSVIAARTKLLGRVPTTRELLTRPDKVDNRSHAERAADENFRVVIDDEPDNGNPFGKQPKPPKNAREALRQQAEKNWDARHEAAELQAERDADPDRQRSIAWAEAHLEKTTWSADTSYGDVVRAEQLLAVARKGDLTRFQSMADGAVKVPVDTYTARREAAEKQLLAAQNLLAEKPPSGPAADAPPAEPRTFRWINGRAVPVDEL